MNKIAIITSLAGNRERIQNPTVIHSCADYYAFTDQPTDSTIWNKKDIYYFSEDEKYSRRRNAKIFKILPELFIPNYDFYFWVDVSHDVVESPTYICDTFLNKNDIALFRHTQRSCIYKEYEILKQLNYDHQNNLDTQIQYYKSINYPENNGLYELSTFVKRSTPQIVRLGLKWWEHICRYASRDQLSLPVCMWKTEVVPSILPGFANGINSRGTIGNNALMPQTRAHVGSGL